MQKEILESLDDVGSEPFGRERIVLRREKEKNKEEEDALSKAKESHLVVAALIATVTFGATFTLPGGYKSDRGTAILAKKADFIVFVISNTMLMVLSISAVFIHFLTALIQDLEMNKGEEINEFENHSKIICSCNVVDHDWHGDNDYRINHRRIRSSKTFLGACHQN